MLLRILKLFPLFLKVKLFGPDLLLLIKEGLLEVVHLVELLCQQVLVLHVVGKQDVVICILCLELLEDCRLILNHEGNTFSTCDNSPSRRCRTAVMSELMSLREAISL
jgi:hypothetical protein